MKVLKFGGSSVASAENINKVAAIIEQALAKRQDHRHRFCARWHNGYVIGKRGACLLRR